jgi:hypothetical protein
VVQASSTLSFVIAVFHASSALKIVQPPIVGSDAELAPPVAEFPPFAPELPALEAPALDPDAPPFELELPAVELEEPPFELELPAVELEEPPFELELPAVELEEPPFELELPALELELPALEFDEPDCELVPPEFKPEFALLFAFGEPSLPEQATIVNNKAHE